MVLDVSPKRSLKDIPELVSRDLRLSETLWYSKMLSPPVCPKT